MLGKIEIVKQVEKKIKKGDFKGALGDITECLELYPNFVVAKVLKAECLLNLDNPDEALALANEVLFSAPDNIKARKIAIDSNLKIGNIDEAKSHLDFLGFLLPSNHSYLAEAKRKIDEADNLTNDTDSANDDFVIERNNAVADERKDDEVIEVDRAGVVSDSLEVKSEEGTDSRPDVSVSEVDTAIFQSPERDLVVENNESEDFLINSADIDSEIREKEEIIHEEVDTVDKEEIVTGVLPEQISTVTLPEKREEPEIKTRTLALIYERQGMFQEALEILENLYNESKNVDLLKDIERIESKLHATGEGDLIVKKIKVLENWLERVKWHSSN